MPPSTRPERSSIASTVSQTVKMHHPLPRSRRRLQLQLDDVVLEERQLHLRERGPRRISQQLLATFPVIAFDALRCERPRESKSLREAPSPTWKRAAVGSAAPEAPASPASTSVRGSSGGGRG